MDTTGCTVEQALTSADAHARARDYRGALRWLAAAKAVDGELSPEYSAKHGTWARAVDAERYAARGARAAAAAAASYLRAARVTRSP
ncbi:hypothetical protein BH20ACT19_BH20ACT19_01620 [soil metagenome]